MYTVGMKNYEKTISQKLYQIQWWYRHQNNRNYPSLYSSSIHTYGV